MQNHQVTIRTQRSWPARIEAHLKRFSIYGSGASRAVLSVLNNSDYWLTGGLAPFRYLIHQLEKCLNVASLLFLELAAEPRGAICQRATHDPFVSKSRRRFVRPFARADALDCSQAYGTPGSWRCVC